MIGGTKKIVAGGGQAYGMHLNKTDLNKVVDHFNGDFELLDDFVAAAQARKVKYELATMHFSPKDESFSYGQANRIIDMVAKEFGVDRDLILATMHTKDRGPGCKADNHLHLTLAYVLPNGKCINLSNSFRRVEKIARIAEFEFGHKHVLSADDRAVLNALDKERPEVAASMRAAGICGKGESVEAAFSEGALRAAQSVGLDLPGAKRLIQQSDNPQAALAALEDAGFTVEAGRKQIIITDGASKTFGSLSRLSGRTITNDQAKEAYDAHQEKLHRIEAECPTDQCAGLEGEGPHGNEEVGERPDRNERGVYRRSGLSSIQEPERAATYRSGIEQSADVDRSSISEEAIATGTHPGGGQDPHVDQHHARHGDTGGPNSPEGLPNSIGPDIARMNAVLNSDAVMSMGQSYINQWGVAVPAPIHYNEEAHKKQLEALCNPTTTKHAIDVALALDHPR